VPVEEDEQPMSKPVLNRQSKSSFEFFGIMNLRGKNKHLS
jgi:hypothetical protein